MNVSDTAYRTGAAPWTAYLGTGRNRSCWRPRRDFTPSDPELAAEG